VAACSISYVCVCVCVCMPVPFTCNCTRFGTRGASIVLWAGIGVGCEPCTGRAHGSGSDSLEEKSGAAFNIRARRQVATWCSQPSCVHRKIDIVTCVCMNNAVAIWSCLASRQTPRHVLQLAACKILLFVTVPWSCRSSSLSMVAAGKTRRLQPTLTPMQPTPYLVTLVAAVQMAVVVGAAARATPVWGRAPSGGSSAWRAQRLVHIKRREHNVADGGSLAGCKGRGGGVIEGACSGMSRRVCSWSGG
jgi:hypothetical protein